MDATAHKILAARAVIDVMTRHEIDPQGQWDNVRMLVDHPFASRLFELLEAAGRGEDVAAKGDEQLRVALAVMLGMVEHVEDQCRSAGIEPSAAVKRAREGLKHALGS